MVLSPIPSAMVMITAAENQRWVEIIRQAKRRSLLMWLQTMEGIQKFHRLGCQIALPESAGSCRSVAARCATTCIISRRVLIPECTMPGQGTNAPAEGDQRVRRAYRRPTGN